MKINETKMWGGGIFIIVILVVGAVALFLGMDSDKNSAFQGVSEVCKADKSEKKCNELLKFGVAPTLYLNNVNYQKSIDAKTISALESNSAIATPLAEFTLKFAGDKKVKLAAEVIKELNKLIES
jgi:hypothetical protein